MFKFKSLEENIRDLDDLAERTEEWRKAQGIPKQAYSIKSVEQEIRADILMLEEEEEAPLKGNA